mmetsp:Transcript_16860/g.58833  ORF Transcript_16860/g.58833 Transcript_16860/m.58833 type:complete len:235 (-) Transcript_16860:44-748(-)
MPMGNPKCAHSSWWTSRMSWFTPLPIIRTKVHASPRSSRSAGDFRLLSSKKSRMPWRCEIRSKASSPGPSTIVLIIFVDFASSVPTPFSKSKQSWMSKRSRGASHLVSSHRRPKAEAANPSAWSPIKRGRIPCLVSRSRTGGRASMTAEPAEGRRTCHRRCRRATPSKRCGCRTRAPGGPRLRAPGVERANEPCLCQHGVAHNFEATASTTSRQGPWASALRIAMAAFFVSGRI